MKYVSGIERSHQITPTNKERLVRIALEGARTISVVCIHLIVVCIHIMIIQSIQQQHQKRTLKQWRRGQGGGQLQGGKRSAAVE